MTDEERSLALTEETDRVEWKESAENGTSILNAVCALANDLGDSRRPGYLVIGKKNDGTPVGISQDPGKRDKEQQRIVSRISSVRLLPTPSFHVEIVEEAGRPLLVVVISPYPVPPPVQVEGTTWIRRGTVTERAREADLQRLRERRPENQRPFDYRLIQTASIEDLNLSYLRATYFGTRDADSDPESFPAIELWLTRKDLGRSAGDRWRPNATGILLFGLNPQSALPGATVEFVRYDGRDFESPVSFRKTISGNVIDQLETVWVQLNAHLVSTPDPAEGIRSPFKPEYPLDALRELARNMVQHRLYESTNAPGRIEWFDDRIVFSNPGGPFGQASQGEFGDHADYRNPTLTRWLVELGYVEQLGRGIRLAQRQLLENGNPPLELETNGFTRVTLGKRP